MLRERQLILDIDDLIYTMFVVYTGGGLF